MDAEIRVCGTDEVAELTGLWEWLRSERALAGTVRPVRRPPAEGELGGVFDMLAVALGSGGAGAALVKSLTVWLQTRRPDVAITVTSASGSVTLDAHRIRNSDVLPLLQGVLRERDES